MKRGPYGLGPRGAVPLPLGHFTWGGILEGNSPAACTGAQVAPNLETLPQGSWGLLCPGMQYRRGWRFSAAFSSTRYAVDFLSVGLPGFQLLHLHFITLLYLTLQGALLLSTPPLHVGILGIRAFEQLALRVSSALDNDAKFQFDIHSVLTLCTGTDHPAIPVQSALPDPDNPLLDFLSILTRGCCRPKARPFPAFAFLSDDDDRFSASTVSSSTPLFCPPFLFRLLSPALDIGSSRDDDNDDDASSSSASMSMRPCLEVP